MKWILFAAWCIAWFVVVHSLIFAPLIAHPPNPITAFLAVAFNSIILVAGFIFIAIIFKKGKMQPDTKSTDQNTTSFSPSPLRAPSVIPQTPQRAGRNFVGPAPIDDKPYYIKAMKECEGTEGTRDVATWAKAFSLTEGDANRAKAKYIELRVAALVALEQKRQQEQKIEDDKREFAAKAEQLNQAQREFALRYPIGIHIPILFEHYRYAMTRAQGESDEVYAARLQRFAKDYEKQTGRKLG